VLDVKAREGSYPVYIGPGARRSFPSILSRLGVGSRVHVVTDRAVARLHGRDLTRRLTSAGHETSTTVLPPGEKSKCVRELARVWRDCIQAGCDRRSVIVALGGGVVGDLAGFAAASLLRGLPFVQVPTTLLAMADASVGGKTGINLPEGKNLVGAFHAPLAVVMDTEYLKTLPQRELRAGWAEVVKTAAILDRRFWSFVERDALRMSRGHPPTVARAIEWSARLKASVVEKDEMESGLRMVLNFGHTLAHAIEAVGRYGTLLHGEAVAIGMIFAARLGERLGRTPAGTAARLEEVLRVLGLPRRLPKLPPSRLLQAMARDKKRGPRGLRWVLLKRLGTAEVVDGVPPSLVECELESFGKEQGGS